jgi:membrane-bound metal-dependent hydrolase YbcI (DUF457 family)
MIVLIKALHTLVWAAMVACIVAIYGFANAGKFGLALAMIGIVFVEVLVLMLNRMSCPLTPIAARFTDDRRPNFDIYLPQWLARLNKEIFGTLYLGGVIYASIRWLLAA